MYSTSRFLLYVAGTGGISGGAHENYHHTLKLTDHFSHLHQRAPSTYDHVLIDVPSLISAVAHLTRDYVGHERDRETVKIIQRQLQTVLLRRVQPRKTLALLFDGAAPLWQLERMRLFPGRRYDARFYRSCASPMPYLLEEKIRGSAMELQKPPSETLISGPASAGLSEGKMSAYLLDLASRIVRPPTHPPHLSAAVTRQDSICVVGAPELALLGLGATPFTNITAITLDRNDMSTCSLRDSLEWLRLDHLLPSSLTNKQGSSAAASALPLAGRSEGGGNAVPSDDEQAVLLRRLAAARTDVVFLYLLTNGHPTTGLQQVLATPFANVMDAYAELEEAFHNEQLHQRDDAGAGAEVQAKPPCFRSFLFDEEPLHPARLDQPGLRLKVNSLQKLLVRVFKSTQGATASVPSSSRPTPHAATQLCIALQTHGLLCAGGVASPGWSPTPSPPDSANDNNKSPSSATSASPASGTVLLDKFPKIGLDQMIQHLGYLATAHAGASEASGVVYLAPPRSRDFALTGAETLLMTATQPEQIHQLLPVFARGHTLPDGVAESIVSTRNVHEALRKTRQAMGSAIARAETQLAALTTTTVASPSGAAASTELVCPHPALVHLPSHLFVRSPGSQGPPPGWGYYSVHLGAKAESMNVRYSLDAVETDKLHLLDPESEDVAEA